MKSEDQLYKGVLKLDHNLKKTPFVLIAESGDGLKDISPRDYAKVSTYSVF
jgi:hypothetical protein